MENINDEYDISPEEVLDFLKIAREEGMLNKYPQDHIIIKVLDGKLDGLEYIEQLLNHNATGMFSPVSNSGINYETFAENFIINLSAKLYGLRRHFSKEKFDDFIINQLSASSKEGKFSIDAFLQALSEVEILSFFFAHDWQETIYENPIGKNGSNPEATFVKTIDGKRIRVNVEVKTPEFLLKDKKSEFCILPAFLLSDKGRDSYKVGCINNGIDFIQPRVTKLTEFLESATKKFNYCSETEINLLYINWTYSDIEFGGFLEAWSLLTNPINGLLNHPEIAIDLPFKTKITDDTFKKISAVIVYTSSLDQMMFTDFRHVFIPHEIIDHHFRMFLMDERLNRQIKSFPMSWIKAITGMNPDFDSAPLIFPLPPIPTNNLDEMKYFLFYEAKHHSIEVDAFKK